MTETKLFNELILLFGILFRYLMYHDTPYLALFGDTKQNASNKVRSKLETDKEKRLHHISLR